MIKRMEINNFRCLIDFKIDFEEDLTLIIGENDSGKTTVIDAIRVIFDNKDIEPEDFHYGETEIQFLIDVGNYSYIIKYNLMPTNIINKSIKVQLSHLQLKEYLSIIDTETFEETDNNFSKLKRLANLVNISFRSNTRFDTLKQNIISRIDELLQDNDPVEVDSKLPDLKIYILDGKHMEDISLFVNERFFKDKRKDIWDEKINDEQTIEDYINSTLEEYAVTIEDNINSSNIKNKLQEFLPELSEVRVEPEFQKKDLIINTAVKMMENEQEISVAKKGDGTKRRITLALLDIDDNTPEREGIYIFDEADTHLHVKAQRDLIYKLNEISDDNQVIITSHSPFLIDSIKAKQIRALENNDNRSKIKKIDDSYDIDKILRNLGIENTYLFFARKILLIEGETEEKFIPAIIENAYNTNLHSNFIKIINVKGIRNIPGFSKAMLELNDKSSIYILIDNDVDNDTLELIEKLDISDENIYRIGTKEFEDSFHHNDIHDAWKMYVEGNGRSVGESWKPDNIQELMNKCEEDNLKFSGELRNLNYKCSERFTKQKLGVALGEYCKKEDLDENLRELFDKLVD